jgi:hypothetical protein
MIWLFVDSCALICLFKSFDVENELSRSMYGITPK